MKRWACAAGMMGLSMGLAGWANSQEAPPSWWSRWKRDYHRNQCWPEPFIVPDRLSVYAPITAMEENGWRRQNLLCDYHFTDGGKALNQAGEHRVLWILTQLPQHRQTIFVQRGPSAAVTATRVEAVQQLASKLSPNGPQPPIVESNLPSGGWNGEDVDATLSGFRKNWPEPRLPDRQGDTGSGAAGT